MKTQKVLLLMAQALAMAYASGDACAQTTSQPVQYRLIQGSTLIYERLIIAPPFQPLVSTSRLTGVFQMSRQASPLDWEFFQVSNLALRADELPDGTTEVAGGGGYQRSDRFKSQQMELSVQIGSFQAELGSDAVPLKEPWPMLDITVKGTVSRIGAQHTYTLHLIAVPELRSWRYQLLGPSFLVDDCPPCGRPTIQVPLRGSFDLVLYEENPIVSRYALCDLELAAGGGPDAPYQLSGGGTFSQGGEVALHQEMKLETRLKTAAGAVPRGFTNDTMQVSRPWPLLELDLTDTAGEWILIYRLHLLAAPVREIWFSTVNKMTSSSGKWPDNLISSGDVLSDQGRIVRRNAELMGRLGLMPGFGDYPIDALDVAAGGEIWFSLNDSVFSESLGPLSHGEVLSDQGRIVAQNSALMRAMGLMPVAPDVGLDALQVADNGEILFSIRDAAFSETMGVLLGRGDLLSDQGRVVKSNRELLARFKPADPKTDYGLDAVFVWPSGEIWFSTEENFTDAALGPVRDGDLLSDQGFIVYRNLELVNPFMPQEDLADFGLDGLFVVTDLSAPGAKPAKLVLAPDAATGDVTLTWEGGARVCQVERTYALGTPFAPISPLVTGNRWADLGVLGTHPRAFYRLRQW
jgi:hypothetical protein